MGLSTVKKALVLKVKTLALPLPPREQPSGNFVFQLAEMGFTSVHRVLLVYTSETRSLVVYASKILSIAGFSLRPEG